ncbi:cold-shock DEAD-box protein A [Gracilibacillus boraciitolerans JCM 21714]|uniref:ATP-dependent RNA helicase CshA n=1 Tax=Gracilibacillus boraciitolerans JCM 21714 TaxID=1298598 RepID=W4VL44_9BACI|nr:DEAD/DEAH box helicase [Gracilibacillus boraciitolerans]GAE93548.1 cold-shock DEAD-box protein A [Gracilibacillus boraciitolerans JCM 21714]
MTNFNELGISEPIMKAIEKMGGFEEATPIQAQTIPLGLEGKDVIGQAQTGTGKTAAFGIPMIEKINPQERKIQGLIVAPTRELAIQVSEEIHKIAKFKGLRTLPVYGGQHMERQIKALKDGPHIVVATPGRLLDHLRRRTIRVDNVHTAVLDEADEMLNMGFIDDIRDILKAIPEDRQTLLFSATMPKEIRNIAATLMKNPEEVKVKSKEMTVSNIDQFFVEVHEKQKFDTLTNLMDIHVPELAIIFGRTKKRVDELTDGLQARGFRAEGIHGDLTQGKRSSVLSQFKSGRIEILVATDVAARGLDISGVTHVYNFDIPQDPESYVHRIGRTGRAGKTGEAISFITPREIAHLHLIEKVTNSKIKRLTAPSYDEAKRGQQQLTVDKLIKIIEKKELQDYRETASELLDEYDSVTIVSAALKMLTKERRLTPVTLSSVQPVSVKKGGNKGNNSNFRNDKRSGYGRKGKQQQSGGRNRKFQNNRTNKGNR